MHQTSDETSAMRIGEEMTEEWNVYILGTDEVTGTYTSYFDAMHEAKKQSKATGRTHCVTLHGVGEK